MVMAMAGTTLDARCLSQGRPRAASRRWRCELAERRGGVDRQRRLHAGLSRPAHAHGPAVARRTRRACRTACSAPSTRAEAWSVGRWLRDARGRCSPRPRGGAAADRGRRHRALLQGADEGLAEVPPIAAEVRAAVARGCAALGATAFTPNSARRDPARAAGSRPATAAARARLEVVDAPPAARSPTGRRGGTPAASAPTWRIGASSCAATAGALRRDRRAASRRWWRPARWRRSRPLDARGLDPGLPAMKAPWACASCAATCRGDHRWPRQRCERRTATRGYAKRQITWMRDQMPDWPWLSRRRRPCRHFLALKFRLTGLTPLCIAQRSGVGERLRAQHSPYCNEATAAGVRPCRDRRSLAGPSRALFIAHREQQRTSAK